MGEKRWQHYQFAHGVTRREFLADPKDFLDFLLAGGKDALDKAWNKLGERVEAHRRISPDGLTIAPFKLSPRITAAVIQLPTALYPPEAICVALVWGSHSDESPWPRYMVLEAGDDHNMVCEWVGGVHLNWGPSNATTAREFMDEVAVVICDDGRRTLHAALVSNDPADRNIDPGLVEFAPTLIGSPAEARQLAARLVGECTIATNGGSVEPHARHVSSAALSSARKRFREHVRPELWTAFEAALSQSTGGIPLPTAATEIAATADNAEATDELDRRGSQLLSQGNYHEAAVLFEQSVALCDASYGEENPKTLHAMSQLAVSLAKDRQFERAEPLYQRVMEITERLAGPDHPNVAAGLNNLAALYAEMRRFEDAKTTYLRCILLRKKNLGPEHPDVAKAMGSLAGVYASMGQYDNAEPLLKQCLAIGETTYGPTHPDLAWMVSRLADLYLMQGKTALALPLFERSLAIREVTLGHDHPDLAAPLNSLAVACARDGQGERAEGLYNRSLALLEQVAGPDHPQVALLLENLADLYADGDRHLDAQGYFQRALTILETSFGSDHSETERLRAKLAADRSQEELDDVLGRDSIKPSGGDGLPN